MAGRIPDSFLDELVARSDIVEIIGARVPLKKAGRSYKACCPFHNEKSPSFSVSPDKQFYHCFGCGASGSVIGFLMQYEKLEFLDAVADLAQRAGMGLPDRGHAARDAGSASAGHASVGSASAAQDSAGGASAGHPSAGPDLHEVMARACRFFEQNLADNARAGDYVRARGIEAKTTSLFALGYAPDAWDALLNRFGTTAEERQRLGQLGLIVERDTRGGERAAGFYDRFRDRLMFPIRDARGRVIGFGGRVIGPGEPKYLNSPETPLFQKGRELYGLHEAKAARANFRRLLIVEGYMDVVRLHQAGIVYAVATLGTATTQEHLNKIFRLTSEVVFCFDGDRAGRQAAWRALENSLTHAEDGRELKFMFLPEGHDPDTLVGAEGAEAFENRLKAALPLSEYLVQHLSSEVDLNHVDGRAKLKALAAPLFARMPEGIYREMLAERLAMQVSMPVAALKSAFFAGYGRRTPAPGQFAERKEPPPGQHGPMGYRQWSRGGSADSGDRRERGGGGAAAGEPNGGGSATRAFDGRVAAGSASARRASAGRASAGRASAGRASAGRASAGRASAGRASAGRGNLLTQSITLVLHHPGAARRIDQTDALRRLEKPGIGVLTELLDQAAAMEQPNTAMLLERWRARAEYGRLCELAASDPLVAADGAAQELQMAVAKLLETHGPGRRMDELLRKAQELGLNYAEKAELSTLLQAKGRL